ncbi:type II toxin-antitoxin system mRNA interferase toxin, RelE/StbE family [Candidatus Gottesmanbacteria bacterium]|nr:type II toxin-antitoxin system mRNA interferase toxin, RelE/StbE family [Candidatus Gottesmanbacteria bacterium]
MEILYSDKFKKKYIRVSKPVRAAVKLRIAIFERQPFHPLLHNHLLVGMYAGHRSINITGDWRAVYRDSKNSFGDRIIIFVALGTHSQLYR